MQHFRAAFEPIAREIVLVHTGGLCQVDYTPELFTKVRRPIWPLDPIADPRGHAITSRSSPYARLGRSSAAAIREPRTGGSAARHHPGLGESAALAPSRWAESDPGARWYSTPRTHGGTRRPSPAPARRRRQWKDVLLRVFRGISDDRILLIAAGVTFYAILALFPGIGALVSVYGFFADPSRIATHLDALSDLPPAAPRCVARATPRFAQQTRAALGLGFAVSLVVSLWTANAGIAGSSMP